MDGLFSDIFPGYPGIPNGERGLAAAAVGHRWGHFVGDRLQYPAPVNAVLVLLVFIWNAVWNTLCDAVWNTG
ncbi:MAG: hypothetical protein EA367_09390 [Leptolyngbya sp. DLM2.Bin15]|nr:MAG: hypothetical protein EA367_09390 [Leptolyngbya sp. DLM2.Bin15]